MDLDQLLLVGVVIGLVLVGLTFLAGRRDRTSPTTPVDPDAPLDPAVEHAPAIDPDDPLARLTETVETLKRLAALREEEIARDDEERDALRVGWQPESDTTQATHEDDTDAEAPPARAADAEPAEAPISPIAKEVAQIRLDPSTKMHPDSASKLRLSVGNAFSPAAPVSRRDLFAGRQEQLETLIEIVFERGQHAIVYGERGVGKTSLATIVALVFAEERRRLPLRVNTDANDTYNSVWRKVIEEFEVAIDAWDRDLPDSRAAIARARAKNEIAPNDVARFLKQIAPDIECVILIDEFDTIADTHLSRLFADTIKMLSDQLVPSTLILLGVADTLDQLVAEHGSVHRALVHVHIPRMSISELKEIVARGLDLLTMEIEDGASDLIAGLSQGFPHFTHALAQAATRCAIDAHRPLVTVEDVRAAAATVEHRTAPWIRDAYDKATAGSARSIYPQVLLATALTPGDPRGYFTASDLSGPLSTVLDKPYEVSKITRQLDALSGADRAGVLERTGDQRDRRYRFVEPHMEPYVLLRSVSDEIVDLELVGRVVRDRSAGPG